MSRARPIKYCDPTCPEDCSDRDHITWFDKKEGSNKPATARQLELLATVERIDLDDLLEEPLSQRDVLERLRYALGDDPLSHIPPDVMERRQKWRSERQVLPACRICGRTGDSTRHHFVPKWLMKELPNYRAYAPRNRCTIPLCIRCHRDLHFRSEGEKSIIPYLSDRERLFAHKLLFEFREQFPKAFDLMLGGDPNTSYEARLARDYITSSFLSVRNDAQKDMYEMRGREEVRLLS